MWMVWDAWSVARVEGERMEEWEGATVFERPAMIRMSGRNLSTGVQEHGAEQVQVGGLLGRSHGGRRVLETPRGRVRREEASMKKVEVPRVPR